MRETGIGNPRFTFASYTFDNQGQVKFTVYGALFNLDPNPGRIDGSTMKYEVNKNQLTIGKEKSTFTVGGNVLTLIGETGERQILTRAE